MKKLIFGFIVILGALALIAKNDHGTTFIGANLFSGTNTVGAGGSFVTSGGGTIAATTAAALAANGGNCTAGQYPLGVDASGAVEGCTAAGGSSDYAYATQLYMVDEMGLGSMTTPNVGTLGWTTGNGSNVAVATAGRPGVLRRNTTTTTATVAYTSLTPGNGTAFHSDDTFDLTFVVKVNQDDANETVRIGLTGSTISSAQPTNGIYFESIGGGNWFGVTRSGSVETGSNTDTTIGSDTSWITLRIRRSGASIIFSVNGTDRVTQTANIYSGGVSPWTMITNINAAAENKELEHNLFILKITGLTR